MRHSCKTLYFPGGVNCCTSRINAFWHAHLRKRREQRFPLYQAVESSFGFLCISAGHSLKSQALSRFGQNCPWRLHPVTPAAKKVIGVSLTKTLLQKWWLYTRIHKKQTSYVKRDIMTLSHLHMDKLGSESCIWVRLLKIRETLIQ